MTPFHMPAVSEGNTVKMQIVYKQPLLDPGKNLATWKGRFISPSEFLNEILEGFEQAGRFIMENRQEAWQKILPLERLPVRHLVQDTFSYAALLQMSGHPDYLTDRNVWQAFWAEMTGQKDGKNIPGEKRLDKKQWLCWQERIELMKGDIPYFYFLPGQQKLYSGTGEVWEDYFESPVIKHIERRLLSMDEDDIRYQKKLIRASLQTKTKTEFPSFPHACQENTGADWKTHRQRAAEKIGKKICKEAVWSKDRSDAGWISMISSREQEKSCLFRPMGFYLYDGLAGMAVFMTELAARTEKEDYREMAAVLIRRLFSYTDSIYKQRRTGLPTGAFAGEASILYTYLLLSIKIKKPVFQDYLWRQGEITAQNLSDDKLYDVLDGNAGAVMVFLAVWKATGDKIFFNWARTAGDILLRRATVFEWGLGWKNSITEDVLTGFAHGTAGIMLALARLGQATKEKGYTQAAVLAWRHEMHYYRNELSDWADLRPSEAEKQDGKMAWCHGWGGIVMACLAAMPYLKESMETEDMAEMERILTQTKAKQKRLSSETAACLCHGMAGNAAILYGVGKKEDAVCKLNRLAQQICAGKEDLQDCLITEECDNYGLMSGIAGIGYACLCGEENLYRFLLVE